MLLKLQPRIFWALTRASWQSAILILIYCRRTTTTVAKYVRNVEPKTIIWIDCDEKLTRRIYDHEMHEKEAAFKKGPLNAWCQEVPCASGEPDTQHLGSGLRSSDDLDACDDVLPTMRLLCKAAGAQ
ncbi:unnamed protein product [Caenorhabditis bovis]|uniref:Uncharacterized protein n=1 Tax=Caenorhabditis bovis TaxID=2654633 RepID=A0A8S1FEX1_9PELO|nr:unnamed protein product [Caenorhabditis bovis]CAB3411749.1 unnamed protein product [Caenorhabditis bovis]